MAVDPEVVNDPTLPLTKEKLCPSCGEYIAVFFQAANYGKDKTMFLHYVCKNCGTKWKDDVRRGQDDL